MYQRSRRKFSKAKSNELRIPAFEPLNDEEQKLRLSLEKEVKTAFYVAGLALIKLNELRLYRSTHLSFNEFCQDVFGYSSDYAYLKMAAARVYQNLLDNLLPIDKQQPILPTRQRQLRPIVKAKLDSNAQLEVWQWAVSLADGKVPSSSIVTEAVALYLAPDNLELNPFSVGEVCQILVRGNNKLKGKGGSWCIIEEINGDECIVNTWNNQLSIPYQNLESFGFDEHEYRAIEDLGVRMTNLHRTKKLDKAALWVLNGLAKLERSQLTPLESKLLLVIEQEYGLL